MAQTTNLKLNLFNGSDNPNYELFNANNEIIDNILNNAKTHNHDGVNSSKINATSVVFDSGDTTLQSKNLEDAVKEVFTEADNKITWITNAIGKTSSQVSNPDVRVDEIKADFENARTKYLDNVKNYTLFNINGYPVSSTSSIKDLTEAINNTTFKDATATKDDMLTTATGITKNGITETGTIKPIDYLMVKPDTYSPQKISKGMYKQLYLVPFPIENPAMHIKKGCNILGVNGLLTSHGSGGWDIGESIDKSKLTVSNTNAAFFKKKTSGTASYSSIPDSTSIPNGSGGYIAAQHFRLVDNGIECYSSDLKQYVTINFTAVDSSFFNSGYIQKNYITGKKMFKVFKQSGALYAAIAFTKRIFIVELVTKKIMYKYPASTDSNLDIAISEILVPNDYSGKTYNICFMGENGYINCKPVYNTGGTAIEKWHGTKRTSLDLRYASSTNGTISVYPKETTVEEQTSTFPTKVVKTNMLIEDGTITLNAGDGFNVVNYIPRNTSVELIYNIPMGGSTSTIQIMNDDDGVIETITVSSSATTIKSINVGSSTQMGVYCTSGKVKITGIKMAEVGYADTRNKLFSTDWGYLGGRAVMNSVNLTVPEDDTAYVLIGGHEKKLDEGKSAAIFGVVKFDALANIDEYLYLGEKLVVDDMFVGKDNTFIETAKIHKCLSFMSEYDNYIFGTFPDTRFINSTVSSTGTRYYKFNRRLIKLDIVKSGIRAKATLTESTKAFEYKLFRPMFINHLGQVIGLEQSCTLEKFAYFTKLNSNLISSDAFEDWSEVEWRTAEEEFKILDDGNAINKIKMLDSVVRLYNPDGSMSNTKLVGTVLTGPQDNVRSSQASMISDYSDTGLTYTTEQGLLSLYNSIYTINDTRS